MIGPKKSSANPWNCHSPEAVSLGAAGVAIVGLAITVWSLRVLHMDGLDEIATIVEVNAGLVNQEHDSSIRPVEIVVWVVLVGFVTIVVGCAGCHGANTESKGVLSLYAGSTFSLALFYFVILFSALQFATTIEPIAIRHASMFCNQTLHRIYDQELGCHLDLATLPQDAGDNNAARVLSGNTESIYADGINEVEGEMQSGVSTSDAKRASELVSTAAESKEFASITSNITDAQRIGEYVSSTGTQLTWEFASTTGPQTSSTTDAPRTTSKPATPCGAECKRNMDLARWMGGCKLIHTLCHDSGYVEMGEGFCSATDPRYTIDEPQGWRASVAPGAIPDIDGATICRDTCNADIGCIGFVTASRIRGYCLVVAPHRPAVSRSIEDWVTDPTSAAFVVGPSSKVTGADGTKGQVCYRKGRPRLILDASNIAKTTTTLACVAGVTLLISSLCACSLQHTLVTRRKGKKALPTLCLKMLCPCMFTAAEGKFGFDRLNVEEDAQQDHD